MSIVRSSKRTKLAKARRFGSAQLATLTALVALVASASPAFALDKVTFGLNWLADPEAGGYYQAVVDGTYAKYGLDVTIQPGSPESDGGLLLLVGKIDFFQAGDLLAIFWPSSATFRLSRWPPTFKKIRRSSCLIQRLVWIGGLTCREPPRLT